MKRLATISTVLALVLAGITPLAAQQGTTSPAPAGEARSLPNQLIVKLAPGADPSPEAVRTILSPVWDRFRFSSAASWLDPGLLKEFPSGGYHKPSLHPSRWTAGAEALGRIILVRYGGDAPAEAMLAKIRSIPGVEYAEPVYQRTLQFTPDDPYLAQQWYLGQVRAYQAWDVARADSTITIAIIDTGVDPAHNDLREAIWTNPGETGTDTRGRDRRSNGLDDDGNGIVDDWRGYDFGGRDGYSRDNDPTPRYWHGTHVAGIAAATGNNGIGIIGIGFGARLMSIKISDDQSEGEPLLTGGANGILYATKMGAQIINCSWGGPGFSRAEQELIEFATANGTLVVAAAGNNGSNMASYPASYRGAFSVASVMGSDKRSFFSNFNMNVAISAPGESMFSTVPTSFTASGYRTSDGTSMASPVVAGAAALVLAKYPDLSPEELTAVLRSNADNIDAQNPNFQLLLGSGRINVERALAVGPNAVAAAIVDYRVEQTLPDGAVEPGETVELRVKVKNILRPVSNLQLKLSPIGGDNIVIESPLATFGTLEHGEERESGSGTFRLTMPGNTPLDYKVPLLLTLSDGSTEIGARRVELIVNPNFATTRYNRSTATFTGDGRIGFNDFPANEQGDGFKIDSSENLLAEGGMLIGISADQLADVIRSGDMSHQSQGLQTLEPYRVRFSQADGGEIGAAHFDDAHLHPLQRVGLDVRMKTVQFNTPENGNQTLVLYTIRNTSLAKFNSLHCALFFDWDLGPAGTDDQIKTDLDYRLGYVYNTKNGALPYAGVMLVSDEPMNFTALDNDMPPLSNGFYQTEKWDVIASGIKQEQSRVGDCSMVIGAGPINLEPGADTTIAFALVGGANLAELQGSAAAARRTFQAMGGTPGGPVVLPRELKLVDAYPNPFSSYSDLQFWLPKEDFISIDAFNAIGQKIQTIASGFYPKGIHSVRFTPENAANEVYFIRLSALNRTLSQKLVRIVH